MPPPYIVGNAGAKQGEHHESINALWNLKWKKRAGLGIYPFTEGKLEDLEEVFAQFAKNDLKAPYDFEEYSKPFFPVGDRLEQQAHEAELAGDTEKARDLWLRAACVWRTARQPCPMAEGQKVAWSRQKVAFYNGSKLHEAPLKEYLIPHYHAKPGTKEMYTSIPISVRLPLGAKPGQKFPVVMTIYGLDGYRTEHTRSSTYHITNGFASIGIEIPGTGDCPADANDPEAPDRLWSSVLDWVHAQYWVDSRRVVAWGVSCGGYYAMRIAHTHKDRLTGVVAHGGGCHHMFDPEWLDVASNMEYPFDLTQVLAIKFGYSSVEKMKIDSKPRFSLLENGIIDQPSCRLLLINGMLDELFPIEDSMLMMQHGSIKEARFFAGIKHMGEPYAMPMAIQWVVDLFKSVQSDASSIQVQAKQPDVYAKKQEAELRIVAEGDDDHYAKTNGNGEVTVAEGKLAMVDGGNGVKTNGVAH